MLSFREWETRQEYDEIVLHWSSGVCARPGRLKRACINPGSAPDWRTPAVG
jgi:hypothetical protein